MLDTLKYCRRLREAGVSEEQADIQAEARLEALSEQTVSKADSVEGREWMRGPFQLLYRMVGFNLASTVAVLLPLFLG